MRRCLATLPALLLVMLLASCAGEEKPDPRIDADQVDAVQPPEVGACRDLWAVDLEAQSNAGRVVECGKGHTAQTIHVGEFDPEVAEAGWEAADLGAAVYPVCARKFNKRVGADESLALRTTLTWAWFRPSEKAWEDGARWFRCDIVGGGPESEELQELPEDLKGLLLGTPDDRWMVCADGPTVTGSPKVPCSEPHQWRAVTTVKVGQPDDPYPGERLVEVQTRDFCRTSVGAWLNYPKDYDFGYTWFHEAEWDAGNRRSICWARTSN